MAHIYIHLYRIDKRITRVQFSTAVPVGEEVKEHLRNKLKEETGSTIEFIVKIVLAAALGQNPER